MRFAILGAAAALALSAGLARAQDYPTAPITVIVPFSAGGPTDTVTRLIAEPMSAALGQQIVVQNVGGAGGTLGATQAANAAPDGYTLLLHHIGMSTAPSLYADLAYAAKALNYAPGGEVDSSLRVSLATLGEAIEMLDDLLRRIRAGERHAPV